VNAMDDCAKLDSFKVCIIIILIVYKKDGLKKMQYITGSGTAWRVGDLFFIIKKSTICQKKY
jgi:hypothetical protein